MPELSHRPGIDDGLIQTLEIVQAGGEATADGGFGYVVAALLDPLSPPRHREISAGQAQKEQLHQIPPTSPIQDA